VASQILQQAAIYGRVSTLTNQSTEMQVRDLRQLADRRGFEVVREYLDEGFSGAKSSRPALDEMLEDAKRGKFRVLLVWKLDRLGRSLAHLVRLLEDLRACNVELVSFSEGLDFTTTTGKLLYQMLSAFAEFERDCIRERVRSGLRNARAKGKRLGRPPKVVDAARIARLRAQGLSWRTVAAQVGSNTATVRRAVSGRDKNLSESSGVSPCRVAAD
jgi:DNA invertase Pin-like site-specific DNA recombinase